MQLLSRASAAASAAGQPPPTLAPGAAPAPPLATYAALTRDLGVSLILVLPLLVAYQIGLFALGYRVINGADFVTRLIYPGFGLKGLVLFNLTLVAACLAAIIRLERRGRFRPGLFAPLVLESAVYAWLLGTVILFVMKKSFILGVGLDAQGRALILAIGAGVNEEIVFRLVLLGVLQYTFADFFGFKDSTSAVISVLVSSLLFSGAHYVGAHGDRLEMISFVYRFLAGVIFALIYRYRSFAVGVYTHAIYDILVMVL